jgi:hypothetical protein
VFFSVLFLGCKNEIEDFNFKNDDIQYYPLKTGNKWVYKVDSTIFDNNGALKIVKSQTVSEKILETYKDSEGVANYIVEQTITGSNDVQTTKLLNIYANNSKLVLNEGNLKFIKIIFPALVGKYWDGNALFNSANTIVRIAGEPIKMYEEWEYRVVDKGGNKTIDGIEYKDVLNIIQTDTDNFIEKRYSAEDYAKGVGMIYKKMMILNTQKVELQTTPWELKAEEGFILEQKLISFEHN